MILVILGTQDKEFPRLLEAVDKEIKRGNIKEKVVVQAGQTKYESDNMEIFDLISAPDFDKLMDKADIVITHGGVGSILSAVKKGKKIIAAARLSKYKEHHNDHQKQIIKEFADQGYLLELKDFNKLDKMLEKIKKFKPKKFVSNTDNMVNLIENYIEETNHTSWFNKSYKILSYLFFGVFINTISYWLLRLLKLGIYTSNGIAWFISVLFVLIINKLFICNKNSINKEKIHLFLLYLLSLLLDMGIMYLLINVLNINEIISKVITGISVIIINCIFNKLFVVRKGDISEEK
ncbi:MAG: GtrA family protein [Bacilli bacterium]|nr:GtrA family protein [Bacilli bacterium]